ncbi:FAD-dependent oxidoreductase [Candidatus Altiarchaeota archaeon]
MPEEKEKPVLVVGSGVAGMKAAFLVAEAGGQVYLVDERADVCGTVRNLDRQFPTDDCGLCQIMPRVRLEGATEACLRREFFHPKIKVCNNSKLEKLEGKVGNFTVTVESQSDSKKEKVDVGSIILALGIESIDPSSLTEYGYGRYKNVLTSLDLEKMISLRGDYSSSILRPSDNLAPKKIAFIQCVGSRDRRKGVQYCSTACCMYALKEVRMLKEANPEAEVKVFFIDIRDYGKGYHRYRKEVQELDGVSFVRCRVPEIKENPETNGVISVFERDDGKFEKEEFDLVVLSTGQRPSAKVKELAELCNIELDEYGFCKTREFNPVETSRGGIYVCGSFTGPKDIPDSVVEASAAASKALGKVSVQQRTLVVGGGISGMTAALSLAEKGLNVDLMEKTGELGGNLKNAHYTLEGNDVQNFLKEKRETVEGNKSIDVHLNTSVKKVDGHAGNFKVQLVKENAELSQRYGAIILATGAKEDRPSSYLLGRDKRILTQKEFEELLSIGKVQKKKEVVIIQCVDSRDKNKGYCSRVCCQEALKNALKLKELNPNSNIYILYRDIMTYGSMEDYYSKARKKGIIFVRYNLDNKPTVETSEGALKVKVDDMLLGETLEFQPDTIVLSTGIASGENKELSEVLGLPLDNDNFFQEANTKYRPTEFFKDGIFVCGLAHSPRSIKESISQAQSAAGEAISLLAGQDLSSSQTTAETVDRWCVGCSLCVDVCPHEARVMDEEKKVAVVLESLCRGCGLCAVACPSSAAKLKGFKDQELISMINSAIEEIAEHPS